MEACWITSEPPPIDRHWIWTDMAIENEEIKLSDEKFAIMTGDGAVQGAMMISAEPIPSRLSKRADALFLELLFTAPRNRAALRRDGQPYFVGVGTHLLAWAAWLSRDGGFGRPSRAACSNHPGRSRCRYIRK
jgi:hypothetical protein